MNCPDLDRLIDFHSGHRDPELEAHLQSCARCQSDMGLLYLLAAASAPREEASDHLVGLAMEAMLATEKAMPPVKVGLAHRVGFGVLAAMTIAFGLLLAGSPGEDGMLLSVLLTIISGVVVGVVGLPSAAIHEEARA